MLAPNKVGEKTYYYARIVVTMTDRDVIELVGGMLSAPIQTVQPAGVSKKVGYRISIRGQKAVSLMEILRSRMGIRRREQIDRVLTFEAARQDGNEARRTWSSKAAASRKRDGKGRLTQ